MPADARILARLHSLYRPEPGYDDGDLMLELVQAFGRSLDEISSASAEVMQAHWSAYADSALYSAWLGRSRALAKSGPLKLDDPVIDAFPYLRDLPRIATLVDLRPWREPLKDRERVESFRRRLRRIVRLHRDGLGTLRALRSMSLVALPEIAPEAADGLRERSFTVEERTGAPPVTRAIASAGLPAEMIGPLMRFELDSGSPSPVTPTLVIQGVTPLADSVDPTSEPIIERFDPATGTGVGIHYQGDLAPDQALALVPGYSSWLGTEAGVDVCHHLPAGVEAVNPTAPGPWSSDPGAPGTRVLALAQSEDHFLWAAVNSAGVGSLWRSDGSSWQLMLDGLPEIRCMLAAGAQLLVGFSAGVARGAIAPASAFALTPDPGALAGAGVNALALDDAGVLWAATDEGLARDQAGTLVLTALGDRVQTRTPIRCLAPGPGGDLYCGGELGVFLYRPGVERWFVLIGEGVDETVADWQPLDLASGSLPAASEVFVPPVRALAAGVPGELWLGTDEGIARYRAREQRRTFTTLLQALPQLTRAPVHAIAHDARNRLWFATGDGLFVYDTLDWFQRQGDRLARLPRNEEEIGDPVFWRFSRLVPGWQSLAPPGSGGFVTDSTAQVASPQPPVLCVAWTAAVAARLGSFDGNAFTIDTAATPAGLGMRYKPEATRIVDGGIAAVPALAAQQPHWRYLQREEPAPPAPVANPAWTREGRLLPPPGTAAAPFEGRYLAAALAAGDTVFSFCPAARVWFRWQPRTPLVVTVRLARAAPGEQVDPLILDRVWNELNRVRPAGVTVLLAVDEEIVRGLPA